MKSETYNPPSLILNSSSNFIRSSTEEKFIEPLPILRSRTKINLKRKEIPLYSISNFEETIINLPQPDNNRSKLLSAFPSNDKKNEIVENIYWLWKRLDWDLDELILPDRICTKESPISKKLAKISKAPKIDDGRFHYCLPRCYFDKQMKYDPYDLKVVTAEEAKRFSIFWTVSASSVTTVMKKKESFFESDKSKITLSDCISTPIAQWLHEKTLFNQLCQKKTFAYYRYWKTFRIWRNNIKTFKMVRHRNHLSLHLSRVDSIFNDCVNKIHNLSENIVDKISISNKTGENNLAMFFIDSSRSWTLKEFCQIQSEQLFSFKEALAEVFQKILNFTLNTCQRYAQKMNLDSYLEHINEEQDESKNHFHHTERIRIRNTMQFVEDFLKLVDCQLVQLCHRILKSNISQLNQIFSESINFENTPLENEKSKDKLKPIYLMDLNLTFVNNEESNDHQTERDVKLKSSNLSATENHFSYSNRSRSFLKSEKLESVSHRTSECSVSSRSEIPTPNPTFISTKDVKTDSKCSNNTLDRFTINEELLQKLKLPINLDISAQLSLSPIVEDIISCIRDLIEEAESIVYSIETISSQKCLDLYKENKYNNIKRKTDIIDENMDEEQNLVYIFPNIKLILDNDEQYCGNVQNILTQSIGSLIELCNCIPKFNFCCIYVENAKNEYERITVPDFQWDIEEFQNLLLRFSEQIKEIQSMISWERIGFIHLETGNLMRDSKPFVENVISIVNENLSKQASIHNDEFIKLMRTANKNLDSNPKTVEEFVNHLEFISKINSEMLSMDSEARVINQMFTIIINFKVPMSAEQLALYKTLNSTLQKLKNSIIYYEAKKDENIRKFSIDLENIIEEIRIRIMEIKEKARNSAFLDQNQTQSIILDQLGTLKNEVQGFGNKIRNYSNYQERFDSMLSKTASKSRMRYDFNSNSAASLLDDVDDVERDLSMRHLLWETKSEWENWYERLINQRLEETDVNMVRQTVNRISHTVGVLEKSLPVNEILPSVKHLVSECKSSLPVIIALRNPNLQFRHWHKIEIMIGLSLTKNKSFTIGELFSSKILQYKQSIMEISEFANNEMTLEQMLTKVKDVYTSLEFRLVAHATRETFIITAVEDINIELEESHMTISTIKGSKHVEPIRTQVEDWERKLSHTAKVLEEWVQCQKNWLYLEQIFNTVDIQRQLSNENRLFNEVDFEWRTLMQQTEEKPLVLKCCTKQGVLQTLQNCNSKLEKIQKSLEDYLETKRIIFPRLFFLSNDELLEILAKAQDPENIQRHLTKLFANVQKLEIDSSSPQSQSISHIISYEGETFPLPRNIRIRGLAEQWLATLEQGIFEGVKRQIKRCLIEIKLKKFIEWALNNFGQSILVTIQIEFSQNVTQALKNLSQQESTDASDIDMDFIINDLIKKLEMLAVAISEDIVNHKRLALEAMIVTNVHNRDSAQSILENNLTSDTDFDWRRQVRYSWDEFSSQCNVMQVDSSFIYGNEYLGCSPRLVITPLTDRCYLTMTGALSFNIGGCAKGPAGTGKTETIKDLSKVMGRQCVVFNCSEKLDNSTIAKLFSGIIQVGSWCCFDEFNRMNLEVLSVIAAQIYSIKTAKDSKAERFLFENKEIKLNPSCGIFITMNPSYAGRVELPDNLSFLFRPVAMMVPDYVLISEVILFSEGFISAKILSSKITNLYRLCNDQLSNQQHYDFGLRSIKSVLLLTGHLRLEKVLALEKVELTMNEEMKILIQAIKISNLPRLISDDLPIFDSIMSDLFPKFEEDVENHNSLLQKSIDFAYKELNYEVWPAQVEKIKHLDSQLKSRHGVMLLGPSASGKTVIRTILQKALTLLPLVHTLKDSEGSEVNNNMKTSQILAGRRAKIDVQVLNPKAITINHLYGFVNPNSFEWIEGIIPIITKKMISISNKNQTALDEKPVKEKENTNQMENSVNVSQPSDTNNTNTVRRRSSLINMALMRRISVLPRLSIESQDHIEEVVENQFSKEEKHHSKNLRKNWQWIVMDGPIDSVWVENLNTVLDDSQVLCLSNGERINICSTLKFLFEVDNLKNCSPATVSRCAMVYVGPQSIHWQAQVKCWMKNNLPTSFPESGRNFLFKLFEKSIDPGKKFLDRCIKLQIVPSKSCHPQLLTLCCILEAFIKHLSTIGSFEPLDNNLSEITERKVSGKSSENDVTQTSIQKENLKEHYLQKNPKELNNLLGKMFVFAFTWSFGAAFARYDDLDSESQNETNSLKKTALSIYEVTEEFDRFVRGLFDTNSETAVRLPLDNKTIYSYFIDIEKGVFTNWDILIPSTKHLIDATGIMSFSAENISRNQTRSNELIVSLDTIRYSFLTALLILNNYPVILAGDSGTGKSTLINDILKEICKKNGSSATNPDSLLGKVLMYSDKNQNLLTSIKNLAKFSDNLDIDEDLIEKRTYTASETETYTYANAKFNSQTSIKRAIQHMTSKMIKRGQDIIGPSKNKKMLLFIDDLNVPAMDEFGSQSTLEMVRQWIELNGFYDYSTMIWNYVTDITLLAACSSNYDSLSERLTKHFCILTLPQPSSSALQRIFQVKIGRYVYQKDFTAEIKSQISNIVSIPISVFFKIKKQYKISPIRSHYVFNLRMLHKIIYGILMADDKAVLNKEDAGRLVAHEIIRECHDRLICDFDKDVFYKILSDDLHMFLKLNWSMEDLQKQDLMYGRFFPLKNSTSTSKVYQPILDKEKLVRLFESLTGSYENDHLNMKHFIYFKQAVQHIVRFVRIVNQSSGHMLMLGVEGCGKYSNVKMGTAIIGCDLYRLNMTSDYNNVSFRGDIKNIIEKSIFQSRHCVLYLSDVDDLVNDSFMDDLGNLISSGNIPDLYEKDELENISSNLKLNESNTESKASVNDLYSLLTEKIKTYLHVCIGLSPINAGYRSRLRNHPSLINCCTIDWYMDWDTESLMSVSKYRINEIINDINIELINKNETINNLMEASISIFNSAVTLGRRFHSELSRSYFLSSGDFIEYLNIFSNILQDNYIKNMTNKKRLLNGLGQLMDTKMLIAQMKEDLTELTPKIKDKSEETERLLKKVEKDKQLVSEIEEIVRDEEDVIKMETEAVEKYSRSCEEDLLSVTPILEASIKALDSLDKTSISEVRVYRNPPRLVEIVMSAVCVLLSVVPNWGNAKLLLSDSNFLGKLLNYNKDSINKKMFTNLQHFTRQNDFNPESVGYVSAACKSICQWVLAIEHYYSINNLVIPKRKTVEDAKKALELSQQKLEWKQNQLRKVEDHIKNLDQKYHDSVEEQKQLKERVQITNERLVRAAALIEALQSEKDRWHSSVEECDKSMKNIIGSCVLSAAYAAFSGPWTSLYRQEAKAQWISILMDKSISIKEDYKFVESEFSADTVLKWHNNGLPRDISMAENVAIIEKSHKWPLLIDPQKQGKRFLQNTYKDSFKVVSCKQKDYTIVLERAIRVGDIVCLEEIETSLDPMLGPLLRQELYRRGNIMVIKLGDNEIEYSPSFKLYLMSSLANPQLASSVSRLVTVVNFTVNLLGLQEQLLSLIVSKERPEIENERNQFLKTYATDLESLRNLEDKTLGLLQETTDKIVNDSELAQNLEKSKITASDIKKRLEETLLAEKQLQIAREFYLPLATRGAQIYFVLTDLAVVNYMYQFSLSWFQNIFLESVDVINREISASKNVSPSPESKLQKIIETLTCQSYYLASHGLFSIHRPLFAFMLCTTIMRHSVNKDPNAITHEEWATFIKLHTTSSAYGENFVIYDENGQSIDCKANVEWLTTEIWNKCKYLEINLKNKFSGLCSSLSSKSESWTQWKATDSPFLTAQLDFGMFSMENLSLFEKLILISILCSHKLIDSTREYIKLVLGDNFSSFTETNLLNLFSETPAKTPIIFILGTNSDPINNVMKLVTELRGNASNLDIVSMGRGQAAKAELLIQKTHIHKGRWIFLQNCDLMISWMPNLQKLIESLQISKQDNDPNFKLILSTHPHTELPIGILQNSLKIAIESPLGIKNQMLKSFALDSTGNVTEEIFNAQTEQLKKMIFNLCLFNAAVLERRNYGSLGFSLPYDFNDSDLDISLKQLSNFVMSNGLIQWDALYHIIGRINYGGRITDNLDRRCLSYLLQNYESERNMEDQNHIESFESINKFIRSKEFMVGKAETFLGLSENAEIVRLENQSKSFILDIIIQQSKRHEDKEIVESNAALNILRIISEKIPKSVEEHVKEIHGNDFLKDFDQSFPLFHKLEDAMQDDLLRFKKYTSLNNEQEVSNRFFDSPYHLVLEQEIKQYNYLLSRIHKDIKLLIGYLTGEKNMTENLEEVMDYVSINLVPNSWGILSIGKSLSEWSLNIRYRIDFIGFWCYFIIIEYHKYLDLLHTTMLSLSNNEKTNMMNFENEALKLLWEQNCMNKIQKNILCYWLPGFFSPQSFVTAIMQNEARKIHISVDMLTISLTVLPKHSLGNWEKYFSQLELFDVSKLFPISEIISKNATIPESGVLVFGMYLDNALWDVELETLVANPSQKRYCKLPMIHMLPILEKNRDTDINKFQCPLYRTPTRFGILSSSGKSSNFLCFIDLKTDRNPSFWILRGTAAMLQCEID